MYIENNIEDIVIKYEKLIYTIAFNFLKSKEDSENIVQETFLSFYKKKDSYLSQNLNDIKNILCKIALNKCKDLLRGGTKKYEVLRDDYIEDEENITNFEMNSNQSNIEEILVKKEKELLIVNMVNKLKSPYKEAIYEYYIKDLSLELASKNLNVPKPTLKVQIARGKALLKEMIMQSNIMKGDDNYEI